jgi:hypothetical protein
VRGERVAEQAHKTVPGATWRRLCSSRAEHDGGQRSIAWGTCGAGSSAARSDVGPLQKGTGGQEPLAR